MTESKPTWRVARSDCDCPKRSRGIPIFKIIKKKWIHFYSVFNSEVRIYKRKQESKKKESFSFFLVAFLVESVFSFFFS